jgi:hypothetical protein
MRTQYTLKYALHTYIHARKRISKSQLELLNLEHSTKTRAHLIIMFIIILFSKKKTNSQKDPTAKKKPSNKYSSKSSHNRGKKQQQTGGNSFSWVSNHGSNRIHPPPPAPPSPPTHKTCPFFPVFTSAAAPFSATAAGGLA